MVGIIVTGHGRFASGMTSSIELIAGPQENYVAVDFEHEVDELTVDLVEAIESLQECEGIIIFTDLPGGSPFKTAVELSATRDDIEVLYGTNLPMLVETSMARTFGMDLESLASMAENTGKEQISRFSLSDIEIETTDDDDFSNGI